MLNIAETLHTWCLAPRPFALATVVRVTGSAPLPVGTSLAVDTDGHAAGSVSGGCVEGAVYELCRQVLDEESGPVRTRFGYSDDDAFAVGLTCGGELDILVQRIDPAHQPPLLHGLLAVATGEPAAVAQVVDGPPHLIGRTLSVSGHAPSLNGTLGGEHEDQAVVAQIRAHLAASRTGLIGIGADSATCPERLSLLIHVNAPRPRMLIFGAVDFAAALSQAGAFLGYRVTVCDARPVFATAARFPYADEVVTQWPHRYLETASLDTRTAICVLTHDAKFDIPLLTRALTLPVAYVGAMGSRRTHQERIRLLRAAGVSEEHLARLRSPIGLDLGARTPEETAISITAEIIAHAHHRSGTPLTRSDGPIHPTHAPPAPMHH
ncbi:XdhC family protein [Streptomyces anulatus]|uniref:XdhC family protein n=1 Tax=Streptomyces anulatus TaxID=1892 RepID=UPI0033CB3BC3